MSIRSILSNAIATGDSSSLGELLVTSGFAEVEAGEIGEALLHYAEAAPLVEAEALSSAVTSYHSQIHGIEVEGDVTPVDLSFSLLAETLAAESDLAADDQAVSVSDKEIADDFDSDDIDLDGIGDAGIERSGSDDFDDLDDSGFDIDDLDGPLLSAGIEETPSVIVDVGSTETTTFGVGSAGATTNLDAELELEDWSDSKVETESDDIEDVALGNVDTPVDEPSIGFPSVEDPVDLDFDDDIADFD